MGEVVALGGGAVKFMLAFGDGVVFPGDDGGRGVDLFGEGGDVMVGAVEPVLGSCEAGFVDSAPASLSRCLEFLLGLLVLAAGAVEVDLMVGELLLCAAQVGGAVLGQACLELAALVVDGVAGVAEPVDTVREGVAGTGGGEHGVGPVLGQGGVYLVDPGMSHPCSTSQASRRALAWLRRRSSGRRSSTRLVAFDLLLRVGDGVDGLGGVVAAIAAQLGQRADAGELLVAEPEPPLGLLGVVFGVGEPLAGGGELVGDVGGRVSMMA